MFTSFILAVVQAINSINSNVWAIVTLGAGVFVSIHNPSIGFGLVTGSFAIIQSNNNSGKKDSPSA